MFKVIDGSDISFNDMLRFKESGGSVMRSAHVGNIWLTTLFLAKHDILVILHEHLKGIASYYKPAYLAAQGISNRLSRSCGLRLTQIDEIRKNKIFPEVVNYLGNKIDLLGRPVQLHAWTLQKMSSYFELLSVYLLEEDIFSITYKILEILSRRMTYLFNLFIDEFGHSFYLKEVIEDKIFYLRKSGQIKIINRKDVLELTIDYLIQTKNCILKGGKSPEGIFPHVCVITFLFSAIEIFRTKNFKLFHVAGKKMTNYLLGDTKEAIYHRKILNDIFLAVSEEFPNFLLEEIIFVLISSDYLDALVTSDEVLAQKNNELLKRKSYIRSQNNQETQYDIIIGEKKLYFPEEAGNISSNIFKTYTEVFPVVNKVV